MKTASRFAEFVARHNQPGPADDALDWDRERDEWLTYLDGLHGFVAETLDPFVRSGTVALRTSEIDLNEENIGVYAAKRMLIVIGTQEIVLTPVGTLLIGSKGRVDVQGNAGDARLLLVDRTSTSPLSTLRVTMIRPGAALPEQPPRNGQASDWTWKIVGRPPAMQFVDLTRDALLQMLMDVSGA